MRGGYDLAIHPNYTTVTYSEEDKTAIRNYLIANPGASSTDILAKLFPGITDEKYTNLKRNAAHEIQVVLNRAMGLRGGGTRRARTYKKHRTHRRKSYRKSYRKSRSHRKRR